MTSHSHRLLVSAALLVSCLPITLAAQQPTNVTGRVLAGGTAPVENVAVSIPELRVGAYTDQGGRYQITAPAEATGRTVVLVARRIGYAPDSVRVTLSGGTITQDIALRTMATQLTEMVVTAGSVVREKSTLGTAQQQITTAELTQTKAQNIVQAVQGKVSGVTITGSGTPGGSVNFIIRGQNTLASNNQPLFIVDGIPVSNANRGGGLGNGYDFGNAISDLNPEDVESMSILKGPNAAAIYGSRAQNGAVIITTKKGASTDGKMRTELTTLYTWDAPGRLPDFQNQYGQGAGGYFDYVNGAGAGKCDGCDQSWGPKMDGRTTGCRYILATDTARYNPLKPFTYDLTAPCRQFDAVAGGPWIAHPNNVKDFFETGHTMSSNIAVSGGTARANARMSLGVDNIHGFVPANSFQKTTGLLSGNLQVSPRLTTDAVLQYVRNNGQNPPGTGYNNSILEQFMWFGRQVDIKKLKNWQQGGAVNNGPASREYNWNYNYHNNPYYTQEANSIADSRDRFIVQGSAKYKLTDWLNAALRSGSDIYRLVINEQFDPSFLNGTYVNQSYQGGFNFINDYNNENNTELRLDAAHSLTSRLNLSAMVGGNLRREYYNTTQTQTTGLTVGGIYNVSNAGITPTLGQTINRRAVNSVYGSAAATFNGYWTVEGTGRQDVSSTLPKGQNTYFYPSINTSLILSDAVPALQNKYLSFVKLRGSIAKVGNDADPYQLSTTFTGLANKFGGRAQFTRGDQLLEPNLKPEITRSNEAGLEAGFLDGRASIDFTVYDKRTHNQIYLVPVSPTSGYSQKLINAGEMQNKGLEALFTVTPVQLTNFTWTATANYAHNKNLVVDLAPGVDRIVLGNGLFGDVRLEAKKGQPYGAIWGGGYLRDAQGRLQTSGGIPIPTDTFVYHGSIQPKWTGGVGSQFTYKGVSMSVLFDIRRGGKIMSYTNYVGEYSGVLRGSLKGREVDWNNPGIVVNGIDVDSLKPNVINVTAETYFQGLFGNVEPYVYDASYTKLREVRVAFDLPQEWSGRANLSSVSVAFTGRNLKLWTKVPNIDPEFAYSSGNFQGIEYALPGNARSFGFNVRITP